MIAVRGACGSSFRVLLDISGALGLFRPGHWLRSVPVEYGKNDQSLVAGI